MLARAGFRDDPRLAHADRQQDLADAIVDLVRAGVVQLVALEPHLCAAKCLCEPWCEIERAGAADIVLKQIVELCLEGRIGLGGGIFPLEVEDQRHQRFRDIAAAELAEMPAIVGLGAIGIGCGHGCGDWQSESRVSGARIVPYHGFLCCHTQKRSKTRCV